MPRLVSALLMFFAFAAQLRAQVFPTNLPPATPADAPSRFIGGLDVAARFEPTLHAYSSPGKRAVSMTTTACNVGSVDAAWDGNTSNHPFIAQLYCRAKDGRFEQISDWSFIKHGFISTNSPGCRPGSCNPNTSAFLLGVNCSDTYTATLNANPFRLGPPWEINAFTGEWSLTGSHFDRGYPDVGPPFNTDGIRNSINTVHDTQFRCEIDAAVLGDPAARYFGQCFHLQPWEHPALRENNLSSYEVVIGAADGGASSFPVGLIRDGSVLEHYAGARLESVDNLGTGGVVRDGRFYVAAHVTALADGWFHYEYAVHNRDNHGGGATFRVPLAATGRYRGAGFKDLDDDALNDWAISRQGDVLSWDAPLGNAQPWNTVFNFWFDSDAAPEDGVVEIAQATPQHDAAPMLTVASDVPTRQRNVYIAAGCGTPALWPTGIASLPNPGLALELTGLAPGATCGVLLSDRLALLAAPTGCDLMNPDIPFALSGLAVGSQARFAFPIPLSPGLEGQDLHLQGIELAVGGALVGVANLSNVVRLRIGNQ